MSGLLQPVGIYVSTRELAFAVAMCAIPVATIVLQPKPARQSLFEEASKLISSLGSFTILNYEELLAEVIEKNEPDKSESL